MTGSAPWTKNSMDPNAPSDSFMAAPLIRVFVGAEPEQTLPFKVLRFSIAKHCSRPVEVLPLHLAIEASGLRFKVPVSSRNRARTPFSFHRFTIPELVGYSGRAIYLDSDMVVFKDISELWDWPFNGAQILSVKERPNSGRRSQFSVMVMDCGRLDWNIQNLLDRYEQGQWTYGQFLHELAPAEHKAATLPGTWNELERYEKGISALTHYTDMDFQPWLTTDNPNAYVWFRCLFDAIDQGAITTEEIMVQIRQGLVRPSMEYQLFHRIEDPSQLPAKSKLKDVMAFTPPHRLGFSSNPKLKKGAARLTALWNRSPSAFHMAMRAVHGILYHTYKFYRGETINAR